MRIRALSVCAVHHYSQLAPSADGSMVLIGHAATLPRPATAAHASKLVFVNMMQTMAERSGRRQKLCLPCVSRILAPHRDEAATTRTATLGDKRIQLSLP